MRFVGLTVKESGAQTLITLDEAKAQLRILDQFDDINIAAATEAAVAYVENFLWQSLRPQTVVASYTPDGSGYAELFRAAFDSLGGGAYFASGGSKQTIPNNAISVDDSLFVPRAYFAEPQTDSGKFGAVKITYKTRAANTVSAQIKQAALITLAQIYDNRDAPDCTAVDGILTPLATRYQL